MIPGKKPQYDQWLSLPEVRRQLGGSVAASTVYRLMARDPTFPRPVKVFSGNRWSAKELAAWMDAQLAARGGPHEAKKEVAC